MSTDSQNPNPKPKFKLSKKSSAKGGTKPSLKLGKKSPGKLSLKPKALNAGPTGTPPAGVTQPPMPSSAIPAPNLAPADLPLADSPSLGAGISPPPGVIAGHPSVPEPVSNIPAAPEDPTGPEGLAESLPPPPPVLGGEDFPAVGVPVPPPVPEPVSGVPAPEAPMGLPVVPPMSTELPSLPSTHDEESLPDAGEDLPSVEEPFFPSVPEPVSELPPAPQAPVGFEGLPQVGDGLLPPPPIQGEGLLPDAGGELPVVEAPIIPPEPDPVPNPVPDLPPVPEVATGFVGLPSVSEDVTPPPLPPMGVADDSGGLEDKGLPPLSDIQSSQLQSDDLGDKQDTSEQLLDNSLTSDLKVETASPLASATEIDQLNEVVSSLSKEVDRLKSESREELDSLFKRVDELDNVPAALKTEDEKVEDLRKSLESLKSNLGQEMESFKNLIQSQMEKKNETDSSPSPLSGSLLSTSGEIRWSKEQYVVVSQDEKSGESSPLDVFITNTEDEALDKVHYNMTNDRPIYFLYPNTLASDYNEKY